MTHRRIQDATRTPLAGKLAIVACAIGMMSSLVALLMGTFPLFLEPVSAAMGWNRTTFPAMMMAVALIGALLGPLIGRSIDHLGARPVAITGVLLWGGGFLLLSQLQPTPILCILVTLFLGLGGGLSGQIVYAHVVSRWLERGRGVALGLVMGAAPALAQAAAAPLVGLGLETVGWRTTYLALGLWIIVVTFATNLLLLREPSTKAVAARPDATERPPGDTAKTALASPRFWIPTLIVALTAGVYNGVFQHSVALLAGKGVSKGLGMAFVSLVALAAIPSPVLAGVLLDRLKHPRLAVAPFIASALLGAMVIAASTNAPTVLASAVLFGVALGAGQAVQPFLLTRYFGPRAQSEIFGASLIVIIAGTAGGPVLLGISFDHFGGYAPGLIGCQLVAALALVLALLLPSYRYAEAFSRVEA